MYHLKLDDDLLSFFPQTILSQRIQLDTTIIGIATIVAVILLCTYFFCYVIHSSFVIIIDFIIIYKTYRLDVAL